MPGAIQVTVLEFKGVSSSSKPSAKSLRVSMGKREFQTWDKGEFSFPITKLTEDLVIALLDAAGNEIAHSDIRTMHIIEKGSWHEVFPINGCGHVHMKLQFVLSEEDRSRIRNMRESVVKKKLKMSPNISVRLSETSGGSVETSKETVQVSDSEKGGEEIDVQTPKVGPFQSASSSDSTIDRKEEGTNLKVAIPETTEGSQGAPLSPGNEGVESESVRASERLQVNKIESQPSAHVRSIDDEADSAKLLRSNISYSFTSKSRDEPMQEPRTIKVPSKVRKMISAFESSQVQEMRRTESIQEVKSVRKTPSLQAQVNISSSGTATTSGMVEEQYPEAQAYEEASNSGTKSLKLYEEECASGQSSGLWIFPDSRSHTCITAAGKHDAKIVGHHWYKAETYQGKEILSESEVLEKNVIHGTEEKNRKQGAEVSESGLGGMPDDSWNGRFGKVIKIAAILGFGLLVLLTRQKEPRQSKSSNQKEKNTEEFDDIFSITNYEN